MKKQPARSAPPGALSTLNRWGHIWDQEHLWEQIEFWSQENLRTNERKVLEAIKILLQNSDNIEIFNKKAIYLYLRELTGLNTKQVVNNLNKMRARYQTFKKDWNEGKI